MGGAGRSLAQGRDQLSAQVVHLDGRQPEPLHAGNRSHLAHQASEVVARLAVAEATEVDPGEHDLGMPLGDTLADFRKNRVRAPAASAAAHERNHAERARERAPVLDLDEGASPLEPSGGLHAADGADISGHGFR